MSPILQFNSSHSFTMLAIPQLAVALVAALTLAPEADAAHSTFRMRAYALANTRLDPIASPGDVASHVHEIRGASRFRGKHQQKILGPTS